MGIIQIKVSELSERILRNIPEEFHDQTVNFLKIASRKEATRVLNEYMNERFIRSQLGLNIPDSDKRDSWYLVEERLKLPDGSSGNDLKGDSTNQYAILYKALDSFCKTLNEEFYKTKYWGFVLEELNIVSAGRANVYDLQLKGVLLDIVALEGNPDRNVDPEPFVKTPFGLIICEKKAVLLNIMKGLIPKGYDIGWYGINTQGYAPTNVIKLLLKFLETKKKFFVFVVHDYDLDGLTILFDMKRYFPCESAGLNLDLINESGIETEGFLMGYKTPTGEAREKQVKGAYSVLNSIKDITPEVKEKYISWIEGCKVGRAELQALTGKRLDESMDLNPARDFITHIENLLENNPRIFNLNRYKEPYYFYDPPHSLIFDKPSYIVEITSEILEKVEEFIKDYLESIELNEDDQWYELVNDKFYGFDKMVSGFITLKKILRIFLRIKKRRIVRVNKNYDESLTGVKRKLNRQNNKLYRETNKVEIFLRRLKDKHLKILNRNFAKLPEFKNMKERLDKLRDKIFKIIEKLQDEIKENEGD